MIERVFIHDLKKHIGREVTLGGWVHSVRKQGGIVFLLLRDRTGIAQIITESGVVREQDLRNETVIYATGTVIEDERAEGGVELSMSRVEVLSAPRKKLPIPGSIPSP